MRVMLAAVASGLVAICSSRSAQASDGLAPQQDIDRYEDWAEGKSPPQHIDPADLPPRDAPPRRKVPCYGWQTLLVDAGALVLEEAGGQAGGTGGALLGVTGFLAYVALAPAVHGFHHRDGALLVDMALRIALPLLGAVASSHTYLPLALFTPSGGAGATAGAGAAVGIDALVLSWDTF